jgi:hypothetical protein
VTSDNSDWKAAENALEAARRLPGGAARIEALKQAGRLRFDADRKRQNQEIRQGRIFMPTHETPRLGLVQSKSRWQRKFDDPIELPDGRKLRTLAEAMAWLAKEIPKSEHRMEKVQTAAHLVTRAAERGGRIIFAQIGMLQAIHRHR